MSLIRVAWISVGAAVAVLWLATLGLSLGLVRNHLIGDLQHRTEAAAQRLTAAGPANQSAADVVARATAEEADWLLLRVTDASGRTLWQHDRTTGDEEAPHWFVERFGLRPPAVTSPWGMPSAPGGALQVQADGRAAQHLTWTLAWALCLVFPAVATVLVGGLLALQGRARKPLESFNEQIKALGERRFVSVVQPTVTEWVDLSKALNVMVSRVQLMLDEKEHRLEGLKDELDHDALTGVASRSWFIERLKAELSDESTPNHEDAGAVVIVRVHDLVGMNQRVGRGRTDDFLRSVATALRARLYPLEAQGAVLARLNGADFGVLLPRVTQTVLMHWLETLLQAMRSLHDDKIAESAQVAWIGVSSYRSAESFSDVLVRADAMVMASETRREPYAVTSPTQPLHLIAVAQWRVMIETALDTGHVQLEFYPVKGAGDQLLHDEAMLRLRGPDGVLIPASAFIPPAVRTGRVVNLDLRAIELALVALAERTSQVAVNVSPHSIRRPMFLKGLESLLAAAPESATRLWIEVDETGLGESGDDLVRMTAVTSRFGCRVGIEHFGQHFSALPRLRTMRIDYLKLHASFCDGAHAAPGQQHFVELAVRLASASGIAVIAQGIRLREDLVCLERLGVSGATGPLVSTLLRPVETLQANLPA